MRAVGIMCGVTLLAVAHAGTAAADEATDPIGKGAETLPIFDAHIHYKPPAWGSYLPATVLDLMAKNGGRDGARFLDA